jgi:hypothetical protein
MRASTGSLASVAYAHRFPTVFARFFEIGLALGSFSEPRGAPFFVRPAAVENGGNREDGENVGVGLLSLR